MPRPHDESDPQGLDAASAFFLSRRLVTMRAQGKHHRLRVLRDDRVNRSVDSQSLPAGPPSNKRRCESRHALYRMTRSRRMPTTSAVSPHQPEKTLKPTVEGLPVAQN
jgi:hypothetical protein